MLRYQSSLLGNSPEKGSECRDSLPVCERPVPGEPPLPLGPRGGHPRTHRPGLLPQTQRTGRIVDGFRCSGEVQLTLSHLCQLTWPGHLKRWRLLEQSHQLPQAEQVALSPMAEGPTGVEQDVGTCNTTTSRFLTDVFFTCQTLVRHRKAKLWRCQPFPRLRAGARPWAQAAPSHRVLTPAAHTQTSLRLHHPSKASYKRSLRQIRSAPFKN